MLLTMACASFLVFAVCEFTPGSVARKSLGPFATQQQVQLLMEKLKANDPLMVRYGRWLGVLLGLIPDPLQDPGTGLNFTDWRGKQYFGNFGYSTLNKLPVNDIIWERLGNTALLGGIAFLLIIPFSILFGVLSGLKEGGGLDRSLSVICITFTSIPEFASGVFLVTLFVILWPLLPGTSPLNTDAGWSLPSQLVLPVAVLVVYDFGYVARMIRVSMIGVMDQARVRLTVDQRHTECGNRESSRQKRFQRPANHSTGIGVQNDSKIDELFLQSDVSDISNPELIDPTQLQSRG